MVLCRGVEGGMSIVSNEAGCEAGEEMGERCGFLI